MTKKILDLIIAYSDFYNVIKQYKINGLYYLLFNNFIFSPFKFTLSVYLHICSHIIIIQ